MSGPVVYGGAVLDGAWFDRGLDLVATAGVVGLAGALLLWIAWVGWMLSDDGRATDYRRRIDSALHGGGGDRTRWWAALTGEFRFAQHWLRERLDHRGRPRHRPHYP